MDDQDDNESGAFDYEQQRREDEEYAYWKRRNTIGTPEYESFVAKSIAFCRELSERLSRKQNNRPPF